MVRKFFYHKMEVLRDPLRYETWKFLPIEDILHLCQTEKFFFQICQDPATWQYLLKRDFGELRQVEDPRGEYMIKKRLQDWKELVEQDPEEGFWEMIDITRLGLFKEGEFPELTLREEPLIGEKKVFQMRGKGMLPKEVKVFVNETEAYLFVRRVVMMLNSIEDPIGVFSYLDRESAALEDYGELYNTIFSLVAARGREEYERFKALPMEHGEKYIQTLTGLKSGFGTRFDIQTILYLLHTKIKNNVQRLVEYYQTHPSNDIILRNIE